jgi:hypothetical protein
MVVVSEIDVSCFVLLRPADSRWVIQNFDSNGYFAVVFLLGETAHGSAWSHFQWLLSQANQISIGELNLGVYIP